MTARPPLIHVGYHKTGTTLLQQRLFARPGLGFRPLADTPRAIHRAFVLPGPLEPLAQDQAAALAEARAAAARDDLTLVVSHERLSGYPGSGGFDQGAIAERLHVAFPDARVLVMIREQRSMIYSMYLQTISDGSAQSLRRYLAPPEPALLRKPGFRFGYYRYDLAIRRYQALFGAENVLVLPYEALRTAPDATGRQIVAFGAGEVAAQAWRDGDLGAAVNAARPLAFQGLRRGLNALLRSQLSDHGLATVPVTHVERAMRAVLPAMRPLGVFDAPLRARMQRRIAAACAGRYGASNRATEALTGLDLGALGYDMEAADAR